MTPKNPGDVRRDFANQLRLLRAQRGFATARAFAQKIGIEENRYTRYERGEVEPSLTLIWRICLTLEITPNDLLGFTAAGDAPAALDQKEQTEE